MADEFKRFCDSLIAHFSDYGLIATIVDEPDHPNKDAVVQVALAWSGDLPSDEPFYVGHYADPGLMVKWLGPVTIPGRSSPTNLVEVNSVVFEANAQAVAGWAFGLA